MCHWRVCSAGPLVSTLISRSVTGIQGTKAELLQKPNKEQCPTKRHWRERNEVVQGLSCCTTFGYCTLNTSRRLGYLVDTSDPTEHSRQ